MRKILGIALVFSLILGCAKDPKPTDEDYIYQLLSNSSLLAITALDEQGADNGRDVELPQSWFRWQTGEGAFSVTLENDPASGVCTVSVSQDLLCDLYIDVVHDDTLDYGTKPVDISRSVRVIVEKQGESSTYGGWVLTDMTPVDYTLNGSITQEVFITSMSFYREGELVWECDDAGTFYDVETGLAELSEGDLVRLEATAQHTNPQYTPEYFMFVHGPCPVWQRHPMYDNGSFGDQTAGDGVYTYEWYVEDTLDRWFIAADVIDADTFADQTEDDYDSSAWTISVLEI